eukprot:c30329_g1_i1 orf=332-619(-)
MAKKQKQKKTKSTAKPMAVDGPVDSQPSAMDTSEATTRVAAAHSGIKKKQPQRRARRIRKEKALEKALSLMEKTKEKSQKDQCKSARVLSLKGLY